MTCDDAQALLSAYVDGELDLVRSLEIDKHLETCPACARILQNHQTLGTALRGNSLYYRAPQHLQERVKRTLRGSRRINWPILAVAASLLVAGIFVDRLVRFASRPAPQTLVAQAVLDSHLRSLMPGHLADVQSSDRHTVKPWFAGKLDFSPPVSDFAAQGFPLTGGRLDSVNGRTVAVLIYQRHQHMINAYVWPSPGAPNSSVTQSTMQGYHMLHWTHSGLEWWLASDLNAQELEGLANLLIQ
ncbi:MAG: anti-sigma factor [Bryobacteraceae bacterium]|jgi:anti-sigma factor RsiW